MLTIFYSRLAQRFLPIRRIFIVGMVLLTIFIFYVLLIDTSKRLELWLVPAALAVLWLLLCYMLTQFFIKVPDFSSNKGSGIKRFFQWKRAAQRLGYRIIALLYTVLTVSLIFLTIRSLKLALWA